MFIVRRPFRAVAAALCVALLIVCFDESCGRSSASATRSAATVAPQ